MYRYFSSLIIVTLALSLAGSALATTFNYSAFSPSSPLLPTVNNGNSILFLDSIDGTGATGTDIAVAIVRLNTASYSVDDIWLGVPFTIDLVIQDANSMASGLYTISGTLSGTSRVNSTMLSVDYLKIDPGVQKIGPRYYIIEATPYFFGSPSPSGIAGICGSLGKFSLRVSETTKRTVSVMDMVLR